MGLVLAVFATPAEASIGSVQLLPQAGLHARGAGIALQLTLTCAKRDACTLSSSVTQRLSKTTSATALGPDVIGTCSGSPKTLLDGV
jgi:hypothetical protein